MSQHIDDSSSPAGDDSDRECGYRHVDVERYYQASLEIENNRHHIEEVREEITELKHSKSVELFQSR